MTFSLSKKRTRHSDMDSVDELPISKKLNLLTIGSSGEFNSSNCNTGHFECHDGNGNTNGNEHTYNQMDTNCRTNCCNTQQINSINATSYCSDSSVGSQFSDVLVVQNNGYNPSLNESENPEYFHINRILYEAHKTRIASKDNK